MPAARPLYSYVELTRLIAPRSVAIVGLSRNDASFGARTARNLAGFVGEVYGVNPHASELHGVACVPTIGALPIGVDCAVLAVPVESILASVEACATAGVGGCVIYASGFAETGRPDRIALQEQLAAAGRRGNMRIVGPNVFGLINNITKAGLTFSSSYGARIPRVGPVGIVSQSGGLGQAIAQVSERGGGLSHLLAVGNSCDVEMCDYIAYLADAPDCRVIACVAEGFQSGERFIAAGEKALAEGKPVVMYKIATGRAAAKAALSHTGTLAGANEAFAAACRRLGIIEVDNLEDVYETASFLAKAGTPRARGVGVVAASGGACVIALDKAEQEGVKTPPPAPATQSILDANVPDFGNPSNPCDITAQVATNPESYAACAEAMLADPGYAALVVMAPSVMPATTPRNVEMFDSLAAKVGKPVCLSWMSEWKDGPGSAACEESQHVARFQSTGHVFRALRRWFARAEAVETSHIRERTGSGNAGAALARSLMDAAGQHLTEREAKSVLAAYGVPVVADHVVHNAEDAVAAAESAEGPVVLKVESPDIAHKTEAGVVRLGLAGAVQVRNGFADITQAARALAPAPRIAGVLVQKMLSAGIEISVGAKCDPVFGPIVVVAMGGTLVEVLRDSTAELAPVNEAGALAMIGRLRGAVLLRGYRGAPAADIAGLAGVIVSVSELAYDRRDAIAEIDVNPVICGPSSAVAVDALIIRHAEES